jgi:hypothetical protein
VSDDVHAEAEGRGGQMWDAPNQQVVRADQSPPWEEGTGGEEVEPSPTATGTDRPDLDAMTKDELLEQAQSLGAKPANNAMTKDELRAAIDEKLAEG